MYKKLFGLFAILCATSATAGDLSYNIIQLGYERINFDETVPGIEPDGDGFGVGGSFEIGENWFVGASYSKLNVDYGFGLDVDVDGLSVGFGFHTSITQNADFFATLEYLRAEISESPIGRIKDDGYGASVGVRGLVGESVELQGSVGYADLGDGADGASVGGSALYRFTPNFGVGLGVGLDEDTTSYGLFARFYF